VVALLLALSGAVWWLRQQGTAEQVQWWGRTMLVVALAQGLIG